MQDVPPPNTHTHVRTHRPPPIFVISTLTLQSPGLIKDGKCVLGGGGVCEPRRLHCARGWVWRLTQHAFLPGPRADIKVNTGHPAWVVRDAGFAERGGGRLVRMGVRFPTPSNNPEQLPLWCCYQAVLIISTFPA